MQRTRLAVLAMLSACAGAPSQMPPGADWRTYVVKRTGDADAAVLQLRPEVCQGYDLHSDYTTLNETSFVRFLQLQRFSAQVQQVSRQQVEPGKPDLHYVLLSVPGVSQAVSLRVAVLPSADEAGRALHEAVLQRGSGAWGVHRSNVAVLGPVGTNADDVAFAAMTKLACWGTLTIAGTDDAFVIPGGYAEP
jgi:hypothetical protein